MSGDARQRGIRPPPPPSARSPGADGSAPKREAPTLADLARAARLQADAPKAPPPASLHAYHGWAPSLMPSALPSLAPAAESRRPFGLVAGIVTASLVSLVIGAGVTLAVQRLSQPTVATRAAVLPAAGALASPAEAPRITVVSPARAVSPASPSLAIAAPLVTPVIDPSPSKSLSDQARTERETSIQPSRAPAKSAAAPPRSEPTRAPAAAAPAADPKAAVAPAAPAAAFDREAAKNAIATARAKASACGDGTAASTRVAVTFAPSGRVTTAILEGESPLLGTPVGGCIARQLRSAQVPPFQGDYVTVHTWVAVRGSKSSVEQ